MSVVIGSLGAGCSGSDEGPEAVGNPDGEVSVVFKAPAPGSVVAGITDVVVTASGPAGVIALTVTAPAGLTDTDPSPGRFAARWDTAAVGPGAFQLRATA